MVHCILLTALCISYVVCMLVALVYVVGSCIVAIFIHIYIYFFYICLFIHMFSLFIYMLLLNAAQLSGVYE